MLINNTKKLAKILERNNIYKGKWFTSSTNKKQINSNKDYYSILRVKKNSSLPEIKKSYYELTK